MRNFKGDFFQCVRRKGVAVVIAALCALAANAQLVYKNPTIVDADNNAITDLLVAGDTITRVGCTVKNNGLGSMANVDILIDGFTVANVDGWVDDFGESELVDNISSPILPTAGDHTLTLRVGGNVVTTRYFTVASVANVSFDTAGGTPIPPNITVTNGRPYGPLAQPAKGGFLFDGWYTNNIFAGDAVMATSIVAIAADHTLYAKWMALVTMTVTFDALGGATPAPPSRTVTNSFPYGALASTTRSGYGFGGWYADAAFSGDAITNATVVTATADHTLYAKWAAQSYTVALDAQGGTVTPAAISVTFDAAYGAIPTPTRTGYDFVSWHTNAIFSGDAITNTTVVTATADHTLYAKWDAQSYTVTLDAQSGTVTPAAISVTFDAPYGAIPAPTRLGYDFVSWHTNATLLGAAVSATSIVAVAADHTLYAKWELKVITVTFDAQGGTVTPASANVAYGSAYGALPLPTRHGYPASDGWWTAPGGGGTQVGAATIMNQTVDHTLYANWYDEQFANFIVIDVAGGATATNYPVTYVVDPPAGGWNGSDFYSTTRIVLRRVRAGTFAMGSPADEMGRDADETRHNVTLGSDYFIGVFPVTQRQWELVMGANPSTFTAGAQAPQRPVEGVSYNDIRGSSTWPADASAGAASFIGRLRAKTGIGALDLPTEAQWEYACRAGKTTALNSGANLAALDKDTSLDPLGIYLLNGGTTNTAPTKVGIHAPNSWGLYDFHGNVWEWCLDWYAPYNGNATDPSGAASGQNRIIRGGSWSSIAKLCRAADRNSATPDTTLSMIGLRLASALPQYQLAVEAGSGSGWYAAASAQRVLADPPPPNNIFTQWAIVPPDADLGAAFDATQPATTVVMPAANVTLSAQYAPMVSVTVNFNPDGGTVTPANKAVTSGATYGALPTPQRAGFLFRGWWLSPAFAGAPVTATTIVTTTVDHTLYALWGAAGGNNGGDYLCPALPGDPLAAKGSFDGFFYTSEPFGTNDTTALRGTLTLKITHTDGKLSAKAQLQSGTVSFSARAWDEVTPEGVHHVTMTTRTGETLDLYVLQNRIWGSLSGGRAGQSPMTLDGGRNRFAERSDAAAATLLTQFRGAYALALPLHDAVVVDAAVNGAPTGSGYLAATVASRGAVRLAGVLADGTRLTRATRLILYEECGDVAAVPLFAPLYSKKGAVGGLLWLAPQGAAAVDSDNGWHVRWEKPGRGPDGFTALLDVIGGFNNPAVTTGAASYLLSAATDDALFYYDASSSALPQTALTNLVAQVNGARLVVPRGKKPLRIKNGDEATYDYDPENPTVARLSFAARSGIFKGNFTLYYEYELRGKPTLKGVKATFSGIVAPLYDGQSTPQPQGFGHALIPESAPALKYLRLKRSYAVTLDTP